MLLTVHRPRRRAGCLLLALALAACEAPPAATPGRTQSADEVEIHYDVRGAGEPTLVLVHGWMNTREIWGRHPETLSPTHRVVTLDLAGHGASGDQRGYWTMGSFGDDVAAVVRDLDLRQAVLVGFSMGGAAVLEAAERLPPERVAGIVLVDAFHDPAQVPPHAMEQQFRGAWRDTAFIRQFAFTPDAPDSLVTLVAAQLPEQPRDYWFLTLRSLMAWIGTDFQATLHETKAPVALINTTTAPTDLEALRAIAPTLTVDTLAGVGHAGILLQRTEDFDAILLRIVERFAAAAPPAGPSPP